MMLGSEQLGLTVQIATVVVPVAVYFLVLGLLNSRRHPQMLTGRSDFALMLTALSPLFVLPALDYVGASVGTVTGLVLALVAGVILLAPGAGHWVIYNLPAQHARRAIERALRHLGLSWQPQGQTLQLDDGRGELTVRSFSLLRNVTVRLQTEDDTTRHAFERALNHQLAQTEADTTPTAVSFLLVATAMLVAPVAMLVHHVPEIVRLLTDLP